MSSLLFIFFSILLLEFLMSLSHPISMGMVLIFYSIIIGLLVLNMVFSWFLYLLVLVFLGGVMILIIYMSTLSANEKFSNINFSITSLLFISFIFFFTNYYSDLGLFKNIYFISHLYEIKNVSSLLFLMIYLLITLICVVKLVKFEEGPLIKRL